MEKITIQCPTCDCYAEQMVLIVNDGKSTRICRNCKHTWEPHAKNTWRLETATVSKDNNSLTFGLYFEDGHSVITTNIPENATAYQTLKLICDDLINWKNGDNVLEPKKVIVEDSPKNNDHSDVNAGLDVALSIIKDIRKRIIDGNPTPGNFTLARDLTLIGIENVENEILRAKIYANTAKA